MPFPKEHSCRLQSPRKYKRFARKNKEIEISKGKFADAIYGITNEGKAELQAVRFPKEIFTANEAKSWCEKKGNFEAALNS